MCVQGELCVSGVCAQNHRVWMGVVMDPMSVSMARGSLESMGAERTSPTHDQKYPIVDQKIPQKRCWINGLARLELE